TWWAGWAVQLGLVGTDRLGRVFRARPGAGWPGRRGFTSGDFFSPCGGPAENEMQPLSPVSSTRTPEIRFMASLPLPAGSTQLPVLGRPAQVGPVPRTAGVGPRDPLARPSTG